MLATAPLSHDANSQKRTKARPPDACLSAVPTVRFGAPQKHGVNAYKKLLHQTNRDNLICLFIKDGLQGFALFYFQ